MCLVFTSSTTREIKHFHVVVVTAKKLLKNLMHALAKLLFCQSKPISLFSFPLTSLSSLLKVKFLRLDFRFFKRMVNGGNFSVKLSVWNSLKIAYFCLLSFFFLIHPGDRTTTTTVHRSKLMFHTCPILST